MIPSCWALPRTLALRQLIFRILAHIVPVALPLVARLAEVGVSPAKPLGCWTAEFTFKLNKVFSMLGTIFYGYFATVRTNKLLRLERTSISGLIHRLCTVFTASKIRIFAFEALKVGINSHRILVWFFEIGWVFIFELFVLVALFELQPIESHLLDFRE